MRAVEVALKGCAKPLQAALTIPNINFICIQYQVMFCSCQMYKNFVSVNTAMGQQGFSIG